VNFSTKNNPESAVIEFSKAGVSDIDTLLAIENQSFQFPWPRQFFQSELNQPHSITLIARRRHPTLGEIVGYIIFWFVFDEMHILNLAVSPRLRRQGIARGLLNEAFRLAETHTIKTVWLEVRPSNKKALSLYESLGFKLIMTRRLYYRETGEDALILSRNL
jgi:ribosomal-protein-alanine N-acetyltransferase